MSTPGYTVTEWRNTYRVHGRRVYREAVAIRHADGQRRLISVLDHVMGSAA